MSQEKKGVKGKLNCFCETFFYCSQVVFCDSVATLVGERKSYIFLFVQLISLLCF